jgi:hypothetical protein
MRDSMLSSFVSLVKCCCFTRKHENVLELISFIHGMDLHNVVSFLCVYIYIANSAYVVLT